MKMKGLGRSDNSRNKQAYDSSPSKIRKKMKNEAHFLIKTRLVHKHHSFKTKNGFLT